VKDRHKYRKYGSPWRDGPRIKANKYRGRCALCGGPVEPWTGFIERDGDKWLTKHTTCPSQTGKTTKK